MPDHTPPRTSKLALAEQTTPAASPPAVKFDSRELLRGQRSVVIQHLGTEYRLQATRLGKLILTK